MTKAMIEMMAAAREGVYRYLTKSNVLAMLRLRSGGFQRCAHEVVEVAGYTDGRRRGLKASLIEMPPTAVVYLTHDMQCK